MLDKNRISHLFGDHGVMLANTVPTIVEDERLFCFMEGMVFELKPEDGFGLFYLGTLTESQTLMQFVLWHLKREDEIKKGE